MKKEGLEIQAYENSAVEQEKVGGIGSAEMAAYWRSSFPAFSRDYLSARLVSAEGVEKALAFEKNYNYPLAPRKVSVRAGYILQQSTRLLMTGRYDSCISLVSKFSLLTYYIAATVKQLLPDLQIIDTDSPMVLNKRIERLAEMADVLAPEILSQIKLQATNLEKAYRNGDTFKALFPDCQAPIFILEGAAYFLTLPCLQWVFDEIASYETSAIIFDYFPEDSLDISRCFARIYPNLQQIVPDKINSGVNCNDMLKGYSYISDRSIEAIEHEMSRELGQAPQFNDPNDFFPIRIITATKE